MKPMSIRSHIDAPAHCLSVLGWPAKLLSFTLKFCTASNHTAESIPNSIHILG